MTKNLPPDLERALREESETTRDDPYPDATTPQVERGLRSKVYSVRLSAEEQEEVQRIAAARHLPPSTLVRSWILERLEVEQKA
ncbi:CopG family transcriptional regulator [Brachybacterium subflavum]|uniref:CopG family transcriptional regulator n=1 Tax=Brachybacterium subflavum TaxID=2585206 RepID=UPI00126656F5|nr:CopG family transcriptional regulator [Brachybacterium subflavum]